jgi:riboflavin synthase
MFTGLIQDVGRIIAVRHHGPEATIRCSSVLGPFVLGESIAINGACLSVTRNDTDSFEVFVSRETRLRTGLDHLSPGTTVNLEKALRLGDPIGGHLVTGHVDARIRLQQRTRIQEAQRFSFSLPEDPLLSSHIVPKCSVALNGVSLTVNQVTDADFDVMLIPLSLHNTTLQELGNGDLVNLETDLLAKYVAAQIGKSTSSTHNPQSGGITLDLLTQNGFTR